MCPLPKLTVRWTIGDVHRRGFQALRLSLLGAGQIFGNSAAYTVCVNSIAADEAASRVGPLPQRVDWCAVSRDDLPGFIGRQLGEGMAEGVAWKFAPVRLDQTTHELALDNDCILWALPDALRQWLTSDRSVVMAEDVHCAFGQFGGEFEEPRNSGIIGLPPGFDYASALEQTLNRRPVLLSSELDEQGLQVATLSRQPRCLTIPTTDISICSPFHPGTYQFGRCGAHFVGINTRHIPWSYYGRPADECLSEHWARSRARLAWFLDGGSAEPAAGAEGRI